MLGKGKKGGKEPQLTTETVRNPECLHRVLPVPFLLHCAFLLPVLEGQKPSWLLNFATGIVTQEESHVIDCGLKPGESRASGRYAWDGALSLVFSGVCRALNSRAGLPLRSLALTGKREAPSAIVCSM